MKQTTTFEAPEGGWGILVCLGLAASFATALGAMTSCGLIFGDFLKSEGSETGPLLLINSVFFCFVSLAGLFSGFLFQRFGTRQIALVGAFVYVVGSMGQIFVRSVFDLLIAYSLCQGIGFGIMVPASFTTFNHYFVKKRVLWMSLTQTLLGVGTMVYPVAVQMLIEAYGFRGCLAILAAVNAQAIWGMLIMHPVEWHMVQVPIMDQELVETSSSKGTTPCKTEKIPAETPLMEKSNNFLALRIEEIRGRSSSLASLGNWTGPIVVSDASSAMSGANTRRHSTTSSLQHKQVKYSRWEIVVEFLDLTLCKKPVYMNIAIGISFALCSDVGFFSILPLYLAKLGFTKSEAATVIAIGAAADLVSRIVLAFSAIFVQISSRHIYFAGAFFTIVARFAFLEVNDFTGIACMVAVLGFLKTCLHVPLPLVFAEYLTQERFSKGYGLFMFMSGNIYFVVAPIVGYLRDKMNSYVLIFHIFNLLMAVLVVPWFIEGVYSKIHKRKILQEVLEEDNK